MIQDHFYAQNRAEWRAWLEANHASAEGVWLVYFKKESGKPRVEYSDAVEEALCFGWIDSKPNKIDEYSYKQLFSPRKPKSNWSKLNKERIERLSAAGLMTPAGWATVEWAKQNGTWDALNEVEALLEPPELTEALNAIPEARKNWDQFSRSPKRAILEWILNAKRPDTRAKRIQETVEQAALNKKANYPA
ncbi:MAG: YdeI/OmpD-associated family protein [Bacteroidetes bacterium]|nr:YdeI/OmpD-associated family protein [Bacteroidota bacterium]